MSISINKDKCVKCGKCFSVCPGGLIAQSEDKIAFIKYPQDCWGCAACLKECKAGAIKYFLGADIGGRGAYLFTKNEPNFLNWYIVKNGIQQKITINKRESNKY